MHLYASPPEELNNSSPDLVPSRIAMDSFASRYTADRKSKSKLCLPNLSPGDSFRCCCRPRAKSCDDSLISPAGPRTIDPCAEKYCGIGKECELSPNSTVAVCVCTRKCPRRHRPVCASNGKIYANHCELHRAACHAGSWLRRSRLMRCLHHGKIASLFIKIFCQATEYRHGFVRLARHL